MGATFQEPAIYLLTVGGVKVEEITLYRFRVRTADGREAVSRVVATRKLPEPHLAGERESKKFTEPADDSETMLANARWSDGSFGHGEHASMLVDAPGLDGRTIVFHVEHREGDDWTHYDEVETKVENGVAEALLQLHHPAPGEAEASPADLRFACELI